MLTFLGILIQILGLLSSILITVVIVQFVLSLLIAFNVVSMSNQFVSAIYQSLNMILDPVLRPIRRIMPDTGMIDFSPIVLIFGLRVLMIILEGIASSIASGA
ncbi:MULTISPECIES: YggT family protein [Novosphingopyxis]|uniref:YggT family protein n=1 Tax=Novosphingopyxis TaxID=2709686 RepID=UPI001650EB4A|nr:MULTISPECIES: YggT family protein [Novosphingopyxis]MBH9536818.1 YggT family protein [Novosphingopyxis sp. YJ-S2-01]|tara:strand:- start:924 stop:1232 length:309 start_codon:yes stop_codon:yes gene_type:complete